MFRNDGVTASVTLPTPAAVGPNPDGFFTKGDPLAGIYPTNWDPDWANAIQEEICYTIETAGITLSKTDRTQLHQAILALVEIGPEGAGISSVHGDPDPHLGGNLDISTYSLVSSSNRDIIFEPNGSGAVDLNKATALVKNGVKLLGQLDTCWTLGTDTQDFRITNNSIADLTNSGLRLGGANARVTTILDDDTLAADSSTALATQQSVKAYLNTLFTQNGAMEATPFIRGQLSSSPTVKNIMYAWATDLQDDLATIEVESYLCPRAGTISKMYVGLYYAWQNNGSSTLTITILKNGVATALTCTVTTGNVYGSDTSHSFTVAAGDLLTFKFDRGAGPFSFNNIADARVGFKYL